MFENLCRVRLSSFVQEFLDLLPKSCCSHDVTILVARPPCRVTFHRTAGGNITLLYFLCLVGYISCQDFIIFSPNEVV